jgi:hypothetical protein
MKKSMNRYALYLAHVERSAREAEYSLTDDFNTVRFRNPSPFDKSMVDTIVYHPLMILVVIQALFPEISDYDKKQIAEISFIIRPEQESMKK